MGAALGLALVGLPTSREPSRVAELAAPSLLGPSTHAQLPYFLGTPAPALPQPQGRGGRPLAPSTPGVDQIIMGMLDKVSRSAIFAQRVDQIKYWARMTEPLWQLGLNSTGEFPDVPNQLAWWVHGNPFDVWADKNYGPVASESHTCHGLLQSWLVACGKGPFYPGSKVYDPHGSSGPEGDEDDSCGRIMEQYVRLCQRGTDSLHHMSAFS